MATNSNENERLTECHLYSVSNLESELLVPDKKPTILFVKAILAKPWNHSIKPLLRSLNKKLKHLSGQIKDSLGLKSETTAKIAPVSASKVLLAGDLVRVKSSAEIDATLDVFHELKGCTFLNPMYEYCGTQQRVLSKVERFLDERSFKVRSAKGLYFLDGLQCTGTQVFGRCDRRCYYFWRIEWLEKIDEPHTLEKEK